jgi:CRISPR-associated protein Cst2
MAYITGLMILDAPASALNNAGADAGAKTDNQIAVKKIRTPQGEQLPYVSAQAFRYWLRTASEQLPGWVAAPVFREGKIAYTDADPVKNWDDDLFGYMRAPSKKADAVKAEGATPLEKDREITRVSPLRVSTLVAVASSAIQSDFGTMSRQNGDPVPHEHEFYRAHLQGLFSLDLTAVGTFFDMERVGFKNMDGYRREEAKKHGATKVTVRKQEAWRLPIERRRERVATLLQAFAGLASGAKQALHYTDLTPAVIFLAAFKNGNHPFYRVFGASKICETIFHRAAFDELLSVFGDSFLSDIYVGWAQNFLDEQRQEMEEAVAESPLKDRIHVDHPCTAISSVAQLIAEGKGDAWFE